MDEQEFKRRTKDIALRVIRLVGSLPRNAQSQVIGRQLLRSGTSIGANYRAACRGMSRPDVVAKLAHVEEEADETLYWLELLAESKIVAADRLQDLTAEVDEILSMTVQSIKTLRSSSSNPKSKI